MEVQYNIAEVVLNLHSINFSHLTDDSWIQHHSITYFSLMLPAAYSHCVDLRVWPPPALVCASVSQLGSVQRILVKRRMKAAVGCLNRVWLLLYLAASNSGHDLPSASSTTRYTSNKHTGTKSRRLKATEAREISLVVTLFQLAKFTYCELYNVTLTAHTCHPRPSNFASSS